MARKNLFPTLADPQKLAAANLVQTPAVSAPATNSKPALAFADRGAMGGFTRNLGNLAAQANVAKVLEAKLTAGQVIVELNPNLIDGSFISDRMSHDDEAFKALRNAIEERGQESPILVRPHPQANGRYQIAFGHRRHAVAKAIGRDVRAVVKQLSDEELVLAQGQENSARADLSFIERTRFARNVQDRGYARTLIMSALSVDKAEVSKMLSVAERIPSEVIDAIGPAPLVGRRRWLELAEQFSQSAVTETLAAFIANDAFRSVTSDERFEMVATHQSVTAASGLKAPDTTKVTVGAGQGRRPEVRVWGPTEKERLVEAKAGKRAYLLSIDQGAAPGFGEFLMSQLPRIYSDYKTSRE